MRIAHVTATFPPYYGGTGNVCFHNARILAEYGHDVHVFTAAWPGNIDDPAGVTVHRIRPTLRLGNAPLLLPLLMLKEFDIIHLHYPFISGADLSALGALLRNVPLVVTYHNDLIAPGLRGCVFSLYERTSAPLVLRRATRVCGVSLNHARASRVVQRALRNRPEALVELPNGVDTSVFRPDVDGTAIREWLELPADATVVAFVGVLDSAHHFKRLDLLIQAFANADVPGAHMLIVGDGDLLPTYSALAERLGLSDRCHFIGRVPHPELPPYLAASDLLVLPSESVESFGLVLVEAMACGKPVIASSLPGVRTIVRNEVDGLLVPPGDVEALTRALRALISDPRQREAMGRRGRERVVERYSWDVIARRLQEIYLDVLAGYRPVSTEQNVRAAP